VHSSFKWVNMQPGCIGICEKTTLIGNRVNKGLEQQVYVL
jgi:hypothetical protein